MSEKADVSKTFDVLDPRIQCLTPVGQRRGSLPGHGRGSRRRGCAAL
jgi:hypothetical protein